jgi:sialic acid synthase SpsE
MPEDISLQNIPAMKDLFPEAEIGFSDHSNLIELSLGAVALGATTIERHITYDHLANGPDHRASLMPDQFHTMVKQIRNIEKATATR